MKKYKVLRSLISTGPYDEFIKTFFYLSKERNSSYVCISNVHMTIEAYINSNFEKIVNNADLTTPDGMPLAKAIQLLYGFRQDRVSGMDLVNDLLEISEKCEKTIFIYGLSQRTLDILIQKINRQFPKLRIDSYSPPFRELCLYEKNEIINKINHFNPDFVFVALGCPKQEIWMAEHKDKIQSCMVGLGGALEVFAGLKRRAPKYMQDYSLEWLYRLIQDPKRLWKRYLVTNSLFIILFFLHYIKDKILKLNIKL